jgi:hypothetical protein
MMTDFLFHFGRFGSALDSVYCQSKLADSQVHEWVVYKLGVLLGSVGHRVKIKKLRQFHTNHNEKSYIHTVEEVQLKPESVHRG